MTPLTSGRGPVGASFWRLRLSMRRRGRVGADTGARVRAAQSAGCWYGCGAGASSAGRGPHGCGDRSTGRSGRVCERTHRRSGRRWAPAAGGEYPRAPNLRPCTGHTRTRRRLGAAGTGGGAPWRRTLKKEMGVVRRRSGHEGRGPTCHGKRTLTHRTYQYPGRHGRRRRRGRQTRAQRVRQTHLHLKIDQESRGSPAGVRRGAVQSQLTGFAPTTTNGYLRPRQLDAPAPHHPAVE